MLFQDLSAGRRLATRFQAIFARASPRDGVSRYFARALLNDVVSRYVCMHIYFDENACMYAQ